MKRGRLIQRRNYMVCCEDRLKRSTTILVTAIIDTGAEPNLIRATFLPSEWQGGLKKHVEEIELKAQTDEI